MNQESVTYGSQRLVEERSRFMSGVYKWMTFGLLLTAVVSYFVSNSPEAIGFIFGNKLVFWMLIIAQFGSVIYLSVRLQKMSALSATLVYFLYSALTGTTLSFIFLLYTRESIQSAFFTTTFSFAGLSAFGYLTKRDLGPIGTFCHMGLWGLIGFGLLSLFFPSLLGGQAGMVYSLAGILIFAGLTAYDTQKIKSMAGAFREGSVEHHRQTIFGALKLYLDFINLFLMLLRLMGNRRR